MPDIQNKGSGRTIVICINPSEDPTNTKLTHALIDWCSKHYQFSSTDKLILVSGQALDADFDSGILTSEIAPIGSYLIEEEVEATKKFKSKLAEVSEKFESAVGVGPVGVQLLKGHDDPRRLIANFVEDIKADLLIVGSRDLSGWQRLWSSSFSDFLIHSVHCPTIIVKPPRE